MMAETQETPKKITARSSVCRLCGSCYESHRMCRILNKCVKIKETGKINVTEDDNLSKMVCRNCKKFVYKMSAFVEKCQNVQVGMEQSCSVKRCVELSPSVIPPSKRLSVSADQEAPRLVKKMLFTCETTSTPPETTQLFVQESYEAMLREGQQQKIIQAAESKQPVVLAHIIKEHCPLVLASLKKSITDDVSSSCKNLCKRSDGSVLFGTTYESLKEFDFDLVWNEMATNIPFLVDIFNAVSGKNGLVEGALKAQHR